MSASQIKEKAGFLEGGKRLVDWLDGQVGRLFPGYFAFVMSTGIISNTLYLDGHREISNLLFGANLVIFPWLALLTGVRAVRASKALWADLTNPKLVFSFFTIVAASDVLGLGMNLRGHLGVALGLWLFAFAAWFVLIYFSFAVLTFLNSAHNANVVHGGWLIAIVGTESLVILGTMIAGDQGPLAPAIFVLTHMLWGVGLGFYGIFITLFAYRIFFFEVGPDDITPLLWVVMGAAAISANAGSTLILQDSGVPFLISMRPFIDGVTLIMWAWATWWIPLLVLFGLWKHGVRRVPLRYTPTLWSLSFRSACTPWRACACLWRRSSAPSGPSPRRWFGSRSPRGSLRSRDLHSLSGSICAVSSAVPMGAQPPSVRWA